MDGQGRTTHENRSVSAARPAVVQLGVGLGVEHERVRQLVEDAIFHAEHTAGGIPEHHRGQAELSELIPLRPEFITFGSVNERIDVFLLHRELPLESYKPDPAEVSGLAYFPIEDLLEMFSGWRYHIAIEEIDAA